MLSDQHLGGFIVDAGPTHTPFALQRKDSNSPWLLIIGLGGIAAAFIVGFALPLRWRMSTFHPWLTGDWLIDYSAGFVRRGFFGTLLGFVNPNGEQAIAFVALTQFAFAATLFTLVGILFWRTSRSPAWIMLVLSPAFLLFPVLDPDASARKELIALVALAIVAVGFSFHRTRLAAAIALPLYGVAVFSHELAAVTLAAFIYLLVIDRSASKSRAGTVTLVGAYTGLNIVALVAAVASPGNTRQVDELCRSWLDRGIPSCSGALEFLSQTPSEAQRFLVVELLPNYWGYLITAGLALIPLFALRFLPGNWLISVVIAASAAPLFFVAWDYGRWIYVIIAQLSLISLALARTRGIQPMRVPLLVALAFILLWGMEHFGETLTQGVLFRWLNPLLSTGPY